VYRSFDVTYILDAAGVIFDPAPAQTHRHTGVSLLNFFRRSGFQSLSFTFLYPVRPAVRALITGVAISIRNELADNNELAARLLNDQCCRKQYLLIRSHASLRLIIAQ